MMRWGIASTGKIAHKMAEALSGIDGAVLQAVGSRSLDSARAFAGQHGIATAHGSYAELWADPDVDIVYIGSPHSEHRDMAVAALDAGKHVLCEKAFTVDHPQAVEVIEAARRNERFVMEAMWSWFIPAWHELRERVASGAIGDVRLVDANFSIMVDDPNGRHRRNDLAGGALLDLGIYPLALGRFLLGEPTSVQAVCQLTDEGVDSTLAGVMQHASGAITSFATSLDAVSDFTARILGTAGSIRIDAPFWFPTSFTISAHGAEPESVTLPHRGLAHEADHAMERIAAGHLESDVQSWEATLANMSLMDEIRRQVGVVYR